MSLVSRNFTRSTLNSTSLGLLLQGMIAVSGGDGFDKSVIEKTDGVESFIKKNFYLGSQSSLELSSAIKNQCDAKECAARTTSNVMGYHFCYKPFFESQTHGVSFKTSNTTLLCKNKTMKKQTAGLAISKTAKYAKIAS